MSLGYSIKDPSNIIRLNCIPFDELVASDMIKDKITKLRSSKGDAKAAIKLSLPYIVTSHFTSDEKRHTDYFEKSNGLILDIDHVETDPLVDRLKKEPLVHFAFKSPSGDGVKVGIRLSRYIKDPEKYKLIYEECAKRFSNYFGVQTDNTSDCARACFLSYDPDYYYNPSSVLWEPTYKKPKQKQYVSRSYGKDTDMQAIADLCRRGNISEYHDWVRCGMALFSLGEPGRDMFKLLSLGKGSKDTERDIDVKFDSFRGVRQVNIGSFFHIMKQYGYTYEVPEKVENKIDNDAILHRQEWLEERAAILEFDAGYSREEADLKALELWNRRK